VSYRTESLSLSAISVETRSFARPSAALLALFAGSIFLSAFLLFLVEPMIAKMVLPILGGTPMVWNTCVLFFQMTLLAGYAYAHGVTSWIDTRYRWLAYAAVLLLPLVALPFGLQGASNPPADGSPIVWLFGVLLKSIGLPFFALATSASLLQKSFSTTGHPSARDPYFLYAASNVGSLLALLAYPVMVEPQLRLGDQTRWWALGYAIFAVLAVSCIVIAARDARAHMQDDAAQTASAAATNAVPWARRARWVLLAFLPSSLMLAVTTYLATDIAAVPLMWVLPLALYLLTFIVAFSSRGESWRASADRRLPLLIVAQIVFMIVHAADPGWIVIPVHLIAFTMAAFLCHADLASDRPAASQLTEFYFWIALGGMLGGLFNTLVAPVLFTSIIEYPLALIAVCLLRTGGPGRSETARSRALDFAVPVVIGISTAALVLCAHRFGSSAKLSVFPVAIAVFSQMKRPLRFALAVAALLVAGWFTPHANADGNVLYRERTFFGVYRAGIDTSGRYHQLFHGTTIHGMQALDPARENESLTYFHRTGPFGQALAGLPEAARTHQVAVVGLGIGTMATYVRPDQHWTFYEIDPAVERIARNSTYFTYMKNCGDQCGVVLGDARLSLARPDTPMFGLIVLDAFSSDSIPIHLMTSEAFSLYLRRLSPGGAIAFHISNRHLTLAPILARLAAEHGLVAIEQKDWVGSTVLENGKTSSDWVVLARDRASFGPLASDSRWITPAARSTTPLWTDDFSNILGAVTILN
jgi:hypothetical protein